VISIVTSLLAVFAPFAIVLVLVLFVFAALKLRARRRQVAAG
jgi:hypothetical protein